MLIEGAWTYRFPARVSRDIEARLDGLPRSVREIAWKAQIRLCARYRKLIIAGKTKTVAVTAIAREMAAFLWAVGQEVRPRSARLTQPRPTNPKGEILALHLLLMCNIGGRAPVENPRRSFVAGCKPTPDRKTEADPDEPTGMR